MKKQMYGIIGLGAAVAVLGAGLAVLKATDKSGDELIGMQIDDGSLYSKYTTPDNVPFIFSNWAVNAN